MKNCRFINFEFYNIYFLTKKLIEPSQLMQELQPKDL